MIASLSILFLAFFSHASDSIGNRLNGILENNRGVQAFKDKKNAEAYPHFLKALAQQPFSAEVHFNLGNTFLENKEYEKAIQEFQTAARLQPASELLFAVHFNSAVAATELKQVDSALAFYQNALSAKSDSVEAKTNIELLMQQKQGQGQGDSDQNKDQNQSGQKNQEKKDSKGEGQDQKQPQPEPKEQNKPNARPTPRPFQSQELSPQDVQRIGEELKRQEQQVRAKFQEGKPKDAPKSKDW